MGGQTMAGRWSGPHLGTGRRRLDRLDTPDDLRGAHHSFPMPAVDAPKAPPTEQAEGADPGDQSGPSDRAESNGGSR